MTTDTEGADWLLYEHDDGRRAVAPSAEAATFAHGEPAWHRVGPVEVHGVTTCVPPVDADGESITPQRLIAWLDAKFARHGEEEDKWAGDYIRATLSVRGTSEIGKRSTSAATANGHELPDDTAVAPAAASLSVANGGDARVASAGCPSGMAAPAAASTDAVLSEVVKWALAGHIGEMGVTVEAGNAIRAVAAGVMGLVDCGECRTQGCPAGKCRNAGVAPSDGGKQ